jgi:hypothetical protein
MNLCKYSNIFGAPNTGIHSYRIPVLNIAFFDLFFTIIGAIALGHYLKLDWYYVLLILLVLGEILHIAFCVKTPITSFLGF